MSTTRAVLDVVTSTCDQINNEQYTGLILLVLKKHLTRFVTGNYFISLNTMEFVGSAQTTALVPFQLTTMCTFPKLQF